ARIITRVTCPSPRPPTSSAVRFLFFLAAAEALQARPVLLLFPLRSLRFKPVIAPVMGLRRRADFSKFFNSTLEKRLRRKNLRFLAAGKIFPVAGSLFFTVSRRERHF